MLQNLYPSEAEVGAFGKGLGPQLGEKEVDAALVGGMGADALGNAGADELQVARKTACEFAEIHGFEAEKVGAGKGCAPAG
jgi:hypothetical protein